MSEWILVYLLQSKMVSHVKDNNPLGTQKTVSLDFNEE